MVQARLIAATAVVLLLADRATSEPTLPPTLDCGCDGARNHVTDFWTDDVASLYVTTEPEVVYEKALPVRVAGVYTTTSATLLMPGTDNALRVIEFTRDSGDRMPE